MTDIFQFGNVYAIQPELTRLLDEKSGLGRECLEYITLPGKGKGRGKVSKKKEKEEIEEG